MWRPTRFLDINGPSEGVGIALTGFDPVSGQGAMTYDPQGSGFSFFTRDAMSPTMPGQPGR